MPGTTLPRHPSTVTCRALLLSPAAVGPGALPPALLQPCSPMVLLLQVQSPAALSAPVRKNEALKDF